MTRLIIRCPARPSAINSEDWSAHDLYFSWAQNNETDFEKVLDLDALPVADSVLALIPGIDVRLTELKVPAVSTKKIQQILPMLIEDELLSSLSNTNIQLLPQALNQSSDLRLVSVINRDWLLWLSQKLAVLNCEKIQLISESMLLPVSNSVVFFQQEDSTNFYTSKRSASNVICWSQPAGEPVLETEEHHTQPELQELSAALLISGLTTEKKSYESINLLPDEFYDFRRESQSELQHWQSRDVWAVPLRWAKYATLTLCVSYLGYLFTLVWQDRQWEALLQSAANQVLSDRVDGQASFTRLVNASCLAAHKNLENCDGDFERQLLALQNVLKDTPPEALKSLAYSKKGLAFELQTSLLSNAQRLAVLQGQSVQRVSPTRFLLSPYANLADD
jgi:type II secretory pathway component PulL